MGIVLFAIVGAAIDAGAGFWICYAIYCVLKVIKYLAMIFNEN
jgi:hypothetical protein